MFGLFKFFSSPKSSPPRQASQSTDAKNDSANTSASVVEKSKALWRQAEAADRNGDLQEAFRLTSEALDLVPDNPELLMQTGVLAFRLERKEEAVDYLLTAIHLRENFAEALYELGVIYQKLKNLEASQDLLTKAVALQPENTQFICDLGITKTELEEHDEAIELYERAIRLNPGYTNAYNNLGHVFIRQKRHEEALQPILIARALSPNQLEPLINLSKIHYAFGDIPAAHRAAIRLRRLYPENHATLVFLFWYYALYGKFDKAWPIFHYRFSPTGGAEVYRRDFRLPQWQGDPLDGKTILVIAEQGLGDQIMFLSCLPELLALNAKVIVECDEKLQGLLKDSFSGAIFIGSQAKPEESVTEIADLSPDYQIHMGDLPVRFRPALESFQRVRYPYLMAHPEKLAYWKNRLSALPHGINIGISWRGGVKKTRSYIRSIDLEQWLPILQLPNVNFINLQYGDCEAELEACQTSSGVSIHHWPEMIADYQETAALLCNLDLVVSVCTSVIHLAGALAVPTWVLVPTSPEWRYMAHGTKMPWYPSVRLYRQGTNEKWPAVIDRIQSDLSKKPGNITTP